MNLDSYMKYKKNKLKLNEIALAIQGFYFLVKFGLGLINRLKVYRKKSYSILLRINMFNFSFEKHLPSQVFKGFSAETTSSNLLSKFFSEIYLFPTINYWGNIFILHLRWGAFSLVYVVSVFFVLPFFLFFFYFYWYFPWQTLTIHMIAGMGEGIIVFLVFTSTCSPTFI